MDTLDYASIDIDLNLLSKDELIKLIQLSVVWKVSFNDLFVRILTEYVSNFTEETTLN